MTIPIVNRVPLLRQPQPKRCRGFAWLGQSFKYCDDCGQPFWKHTHRQWRGELVAITREQAEGAKALAGRQAARAARALQATDGTT